MRRCEAPGDDVEAVVLVRQGLLQPRPGGHHPAGVAALRHRDSERTLGNRRVVVQNADAVDAWENKADASEPQQSHR